MSKVALMPKNKPSKAMVEKSPKGINLKQPYYRVIIGVNTFKDSTQYLCYRKDITYHFVVNTVNFNTSQVTDKRFIFTEYQYENLLDYLSQFDDGCLYTIAKIGKKKIDPYSLLPII